MRIGIYGSAFDPITYAHLWTAKTVANRRKLDKVIFVPSSNARGDKGRRLTDNEHRWNMLQLAIKNKPLFEADRVELDTLGCYHYTYYTMEYFKKKYPNDELFFIMGADNLESLSSWKFGEDLIKNNKFIVMARDNYNMLEIIAKDKMLRKYEMEHFDLLHKGLSMEISSSYIRDEISMGGDGEFLLPDVCMDYIKEHKLYQ